MFEKILYFRNRYFSWRVISLVIFLFLVIGVPFTVFLTQRSQDIRQRASEITHRPDPKKEKLKRYGYIVQFKQDPLIVKNQPLEVKTQSTQHKQSLIEEHHNAKNNILAILGKKNIVTNQQSQKVTANTLVVQQEYANVFNGITLDITQEQAEKIKRESPYVKNIYPNYEVHANLYDSVPLITADQVWQQKDSKGKNITGQDTTVAIIDTGVDYTHEDLGGTKIDDRQYEYTSELLDLFHSPSNDLQQVFSLDNNKLAFPSGNTIRIYDFNAETKTSFNLFASDLYAIRIAMHDDIIAYYATNPDLSTVGLYFYNTTTQEHKKIIDTKDIQFLSIANKKIVYVKDFGDNNGLRGVMYDTATGLETGIGSIGRFGWESSMLLASDNLAVTSVLGDYCYEKLAIYNLDTNETRYLFPPELGGVLDFKGNKILYVPCGDDNYSQSIYYLYDITTNQVTKMEYPKIGGNFNVGYSVNKQDFNYFLIYGWSSKGSIGDNLIFFSKDYFVFNKTIAYDIVQNRYAKINLLKNSFSLAAEGKRVCFLANDFRIYCHIYESSNPYPLPAQIFNNKIIGGYNFVGNDADPLDDNGHGTHVAATAGGGNFITTTTSIQGGPTPRPTPVIIGPLKGIAPGAKIVAYKVLDALGSGSFSNIIAAIDTATQTRLDTDPTNNIDIISMSLGLDCKAYFGGFTKDCGPDDPISQAVDVAVDAGIVAVIAAGNSGNNGEGTISSPGTARKAITVGAVDKNKIIANFSSRGPVIWNDETLHKPDIVAPGVSICAAEWDVYAYSNRCLDNKHTAINGTSMATPHVAGVASLLKQAHPEWSPMQIKDAITKTAQDLNYDRDIQGSGLVDTFAALTFTQMPTPTPEPPVCNACSADVNKDGRVSTIDYSLMVTCFDKEATDRCISADINKNGVTDIEDYGCVINMFGQTCSQ